MEEQDVDVLKLEFKQIKDLANAVSLAQKAQMMCKSEYWSILEEKIKKRSIEDKEKWLSTSVSDDAANILRHKAMAYRDMLRMVAADIGKGRMAASMLQKRAELLRKSREQL